MIQQHQQEVITSSPDINTGNTNTTTTTTNNGHVFSSSDEDDSLECPLSLRITASPARMRVVSKQQHQQKKPAAVDASFLQSPRVSILKDASSSRLPQPSPRGGAYSNSSHTSGAPLVDEECGSSSVSVSGVTSTTTQQQQPVTTPRSGRRIRFL